MADTSEHLSLVDEAQDPDGNIAANAYCISVIIAASNMRRLFFGSCHP